MIEAVVIGDPISHSRSPAIHNAAFRELSLDWLFRAIEVPLGHAASAIEAMRHHHWGGMSVTMPHKEAVVTLVDERSEAVEILNAANCIVPIEGGRLRAENTDGAGFVRGLADDFSITPMGRRAVVFGAGGAARAVVVALAAAGADEIVVVNRTEARANHAARLAGTRGRVGSPADISDASLVVNATPAGMHDDLTMACPPELLSPGQYAVDLVYSPAVTPWLAALTERGVHNANGLSMLVHQAAVAFEMWTGLDAPVAVMRQVVSAD